MKKKQNKQKSNILICILMFEVIAICLAMRLIPMIGEQHGKGNVTNNSTADDLVDPGKAEEPAINAVTEPDESPYASEEEIRQWMNAVKEQYEWSKDTPFGWIGAPTVENSAKEATCIALPAVALQRLGIFDKGEWFAGSKYGTLKGNSGKDKLLERTDLFEVKKVNANIRDIKGELRKGDIIIFTTPHIMIFTGLDDNGRPLWYSTGRGTVRAGGRIRYYEDKKVSHVVRFLHQPDNKLA